MENAIFISGAYLMAAVIIWTAEKRRKYSLNYTLLPFATLWLASNLAYIGIPTIFKSIYGISPFASETLTSASLGKQSAAISAGTISFAVGTLLCTKTIAKLTKKENQRLLFARINDARAQIANAACSYANELGLISITTSLVGIIFEAHTRFSSYIQNGIISKIISSSMVREVSANAFIFASVAFLANSQTTQRQPHRRRKIITFALLLSIFLIDVKTGSRSILAAHLGIAFCGIVVFNNYKPKGILKASAAATLIVMLLIPAGETLRIARSRSSFFKDNPIEAIRTIATSSDTRMNVRSMAKNNRRDEFSDAAFLDQETCKNALKSYSGNRTNTNTLKSKEAKRCMNFAESQIGFSDIKSRYFELVRTGNRDSNDGERKARHVALLGISPAAISKGETINLYADLYQRNGLTAIIIWFFMMGMSVKIIETIITIATCRIPSAYGYMLATTPLFMLSGSASYTVEFFVFGFPKLIIKLIGISVATGGLALVLRRTTLRLQSRQ